MSNTSSPFFFHAVDLHVFTRESSLGHRVGADENMFHVCLESYPIVSEPYDVRESVLANPTQQIFRSLMTDGELQSPDGSQLMKPAFFGDNIVLYDSLSMVGDERWLHEADGEKFFLPPVSWSPSIAYFQHL